MRRARHFARNHAHHFPQFFHQVLFGVQPPGGVGDQHVHVARTRRFDGIEQHGRRIRAGRMFNHVAAGALPPDFQLLDGGGAEGVSGDQQHVFALRLEFARQFADCRGFARAVDADDENHVGRGAAHVNRLFVAFQNRLHFAFQVKFDLRRVAQLLFRHFVLQAADNALRRRHAEIGENQDFFEMLNQFVVNARSRRQQLLDFGDKAKMRLRQPFFQPLEKALFIKHLVNQFQQARLIVRADRLDGLFGVFLLRGLLMFNLLNFLFQRFAEIFQFLPRKRLFRRLFVFRKNRAVGFDGEFRFAALRVAFAGKTGDKRRMRRVVRRKFGGLFEVIDRLIQPVFAQIHLPDGGVQLAGEQVALGEFQAFAIGVNRLFRLLALLMNRAEPEQAVGLFVVVARRVEMPVFILSRFLVFFQRGETFRQNFQQRGQPFFRRVRHPQGAFGVIGRVLMPAMPEFQRAEIRQRVEDRLSLRVAVGGKGFFIAGNRRVIILLRLRNRAEPMRNIRDALRLRPFFQGGFEGGFRGGEVLLLLRQRTEQIMEFKGFFMVERDKLRGVFQMRQGIVLAPDVAQNFGEIKFGGGVLLRAALNRLFIVINRPLQRFRVQPFLLVFPCRLPPKRFIDFR